jgi:hypothetical protein
MINLIVEEPYIDVAGHQHDGDRGGVVVVGRRQGGPQRPRGHTDRIDTAPDLRR